MSNFFSKAGQILLGQGGSKSSTKQLETMSPEQKALFNQLLGGATSEYGKATPSTPFQTYVEPTQYDTAYLNKAFGPEGQATEQATNQALMNVLSGKPAYDINEDATRKYYENYVRAPMMREYQETTAPLLAESFSGPSYWSSGRADATQKSISDLTNKLNESWYNLAYQDELARRQALESAAGRQVQGLSAAPGVAQSNITSYATAAAYARQIEQERIASQMARWLSGENVDGQYISAYNPNVQLAMSLMGVQPFTYATQQQEIGKGIIPSLVSGMSLNIGGGGSSKS
jgi:hypothetical protein